MNGLSLFYDRNTVCHFVFPALALTVPMTSHAGIFFLFFQLFAPGSRELGRHFKLSEMGIPSQSN